MTPDTPARQYLPSDLTTAQLRALKLVHDFRMLRRNKGWVGGGGARISLIMASQLTGMGLIRKHTAGNYPELVLTGNGVNLCNVITARRERKAA